MLRNQSTMFNINYVTDDDDALILINDVTHDDDDSILINDATDNGNASITQPGQENENKVSKTQIPGQRNGTGINDVENGRKEEQL